MEHIFDLVFFLLESGKEVQNPSEGSGASQPESSQLMFSRVQASHGRAEGGGQGGGLSRAFSNGVSAYVKSVAQRDSRNTP